MRLFHVTFGQRFPREEHPTFPKAHRDGWVDILASDEHGAREIAVARLGQAWSGLYPDDDDWREHSVPFYPMGVLATFVQGELYP